MCVYLQDVTEREKRKEKLNFSLEVKQEKQTKAQRQKLDNISIAIRVTRK